MSDDVSAPCWWDAILADVRCERHGGPILECPGFTMGLALRDVVVGLAAEAPGDE